MGAALSDHPRWSAAQYRTGLSPVKSAWCPGALSCEVPACACAEQASRGHQRELHCPTNHDGVRPRYRNELSPVKSAWCPGALSCEVLACACAEQASKGCQREPHCQTNHNGTRPRYRTELRVLLKVPGVLVH
ncbi:hypothetical protein NDU88_007498 [Pleurodeles waltl]|uniref:Uncharacterized protein n=1 Tax=Pleurodeles waltl TaxID=8319 RepID=A0AAV7M020_PLEWA|nr:hypothetical protein NDU88_007498 [Pleurodeles waltl]